MFKYNLLSEKYEIVPQKTDTTFSYIHTVLKYILIPIYLHLFYTELYSSEFITLNLKIPWVSFEHFPCPKIPFPPYKLHATSTLMLSVNRVIYHTQA